MLTDLKSTNELKSLSVTTDTRPRILFLEASTGFGGSGSALCYLLQSFDKSRFAPVLSTYFRSRSTHLERVQSYGIPYLPVSESQAYEPWAAPIVSKRRNRWSRKIALLFSWTYYCVGVQGRIILRLTRLLKRERIAVVVLNNDLHLQAAGIIAARIAGIPVLVRKAGGIGEGHFLKKLLTGWVNVFIAISEATRSDQLKNPKSKRVVLIHGAVDLWRFQAAPSRWVARRKLGLPEGAVIVGSAARLADGKGQRELLLAAQKVLAQFPDVIFYLVGSEDPAYLHENLLGKLQNLAMELGISSSVDFPGWRDDMDVVLSAIDIFVHCPSSFIEGLSVVNLEAMACGRPTIVSRNGGLPDAVVDGVTGRVVEPGDTDELAEAMISLIRNPEKAIRMGQNARKRVAEDFDIENMTRAYEDLISEFCPSRQTASGRHKLA